MSHWVVLATIIGAMFWALLVLKLHRKKLHFFKFFAGSVGLFTLLMIPGKIFLSEYFSIAAAYVMRIVSLASTAFKISLIQSTITVFHLEEIISFKITYECSGLIETIIFISVLMFFPLFMPLRKLVIGLIGSVCIFAANIVRLITITYAVIFWGDAGFFIGHVIVGRILFIGAMLLLYYKAFTKPQLFGTRSARKESIC